MFNEYYDAATNTYSTNTYSTNPAYKEIFKLDKMLTDANIPHTLDKLFDGWQLVYPDINNWVMDAIEHYGSYGNSCDELEIMGLLTPEEAEYDSVLGCLTAEDVFERIRKHYAGEWDEYIKSLTAPTSEETPKETLDNAPMTHEETPKETLDNAPMTHEEFVAQMREAYETYYEQHDDEEEVHSAMDNIMCRLLRQLGYGEGIDIFENTPKWYA